MSTTLANFLFEAVNFLLLAGVLGWVLFRPVRAALDREQERHAAEEARIAAMKEEAQTLREEARTARENLQQELESQRKQLLAEARAEARKLLDEARQARESEHRAMEEDRCGERDSRTREMADALGRLAAASLRRLLEQLQGPDLDLALIQGVCEQLRTLQGTGSESVLVETARPLEERGRSLLREVLGDAFEERVVPELGAGLRVTTPAGRVDGSAVSLAREAAEQITAGTGGDHGR